MRVVVIGGGVVGLGCAYEAARGGAEVIVLDRGRAGRGASLGNAGSICPSFTYPLAGPGQIRSGLRHMFDSDGALVIRPRPDLGLVRWLTGFARACSETRFRHGTKALLGLNTRTYEVLDRWAADGVEFEQHHTGLLLVARDEAGLAPYRLTFDALAELGFGGVTTSLGPGELAELEPALDPARAAVGVHSVDDRVVRPETLTAGLAAALRTGGADVREGAAVLGIERAGGAWRVRLAGGEGLEADKVLVACGVDTPRLVKPLGVRLPIIGAKGYSVTVRGEGTAPSHALYMAETKVGTSAYDGATRVAGVFEIPGRDTDPTARRIDSMLEATAAYLRDWRPGEILLRWAGLRPATPDGLPYLAEVPGQPGLVVAAGHGMLGVTLSAGTAVAVAPLLLDQPADAVLAPFGFSSRL